MSFKLYDMDHDGYLSKEELEKVLLQLVNTETSLKVPIRMI